MKFLNQAETNAAKFCVFCLLWFAHTYSSPVIYIIHNKIFHPIKLLSSGIILTEKYILTTKYPFADYVRSDLCALGVSNLETVEEFYIKQYCLNVAQVHYTISGLVLIELERPVTFYYQLDTAQVLAITDREADSLLTNCQIVFNQRNAHGDVVQQNLSPVKVKHTARVDVPEKNTNESDHETPPRQARSVATKERATLAVDLKTSHKFCVQDNGLPLICEAAVLGVFLFESEAGKHCCVTECAEMEKIEVVKLYSAEVQELLRKFIFQG